MNDPLVSVVMVVCNVQRFLGEAIESVLQQTFRDFEFIIVDFGSTDGSKLIVSNYAAQDRRVKFREIPNCVLPVARNAGSALAKGRYIAVMDADDVCLPERLMREVEFLEKHPDIGIIGSPVEWIDATGRSLGIQKVPREDREIRVTFFNRCPFWHPTILMRRKAFVAVDGYREAFVYAHDYDLESRISDHYRCANLEQIVLKYRIHPSQVTFCKQRQQTLCKLAAQASLVSRRSGAPDPLDAVQEITPALLANLGVSEAAQQNALVSDCRNWIRSMSAAREYSVVLSAALETLNSKLPYVERWQIAELHLTVARLHWNQGRFIESFLATIRALLTRPAVVGRPFKQLLSRIRLHRERSAKLSVLGHP